MSDTPAPNSESQTPAAVPRAFPLSFALLAGVCWAGVLALVLLVNLRQEVGILTPMRLLFVILVVTAGVLTFAPIQRYLELPRLTFEGTLGTSLLCYTVAFVPPPTDWLFSLPDMPVYGLLLLAVFETVAAIALPFVVLLRRRLIRQRVRRLALPPARRQSYEIGLFAAGVVLFASMRVLTWVSTLLLLLILATTELMILSRRQ